MLGARRQRADRDRRARPGVAGVQGRAARARSSSSASSTTCPSATTPIKPLKLDKKKVLDFHQALSSLGAYPALQRKLGLVFDLELPLDFLAATSLTAPGELRIIAARRAWHADAATTVPATSTAYVHVKLGTQQLFAVAPRSMLGHPTGIDPARAARPRQGLVRGRPGRRRRRDAQDRHAGGQRDPAARAVAAAAPGGLRPGHDPVVTSLRRFLALRRRPRAHDARHVHPVEGPERRPRARTSHSSPRSAPRT